MRALLLVVAMASAVRAEPPHASLAAVPAHLRRPLSMAIPQRAWLTWYGEQGGITTMRGAAKSFDDVSEFMRALNNIVQCPRGVARVVERQRNGQFRVELIGGPPGGVDYARADLHFFFSGLELRSTVTKGELVEFELTFSAPP